MLIGGLHALSPTLTASHQLPTDTFRWREQNPKRVNFRGGNFMNEGRPNARVTGQTIFRSITSALAGFSVWVRHGGHCRRRADDSGAVGLERRRSRNSDCFGALWNGRRSAAWGMADRPIWKKGDVVCIGVLYIVSAIGSALATDVYLVCPCSADWRIGPAS